MPVVIGKDWRPGREKGLFFDAFLVWQHVGKLGHRASDFQSVAAAREQVQNMQLPNAVDCRLGSCTDILRFCHWLLHTHVPVAGMWGSRACLHLVAALAHKAKHFRRLETETKATACYFVVLAS